MKTGLVAMALMLGIQSVSFAGGILCSVQANVQSISLHFKERNIAMSREIGAELTALILRIQDNEMVEAEIGQERAVVVKPILDDMLKVVGSFPLYNDTDLDRLVVNLETLEEVLERAYRLDFESSKSSL